LRLAAWFGPDAMPRGIFSADPTILVEGLGESIEDLDLAIEEALGELARFSLKRLTDETVSVHRLLHGVEQDALTKEECARWLEWAVRLFLALPRREAFIAQAHGEALLEHARLLWSGHYVEGEQKALLMTHYYFSEETLGLYAVEQKLGSRVLLHMALLRVVCGIARWNRYVDEA
jgi:hypothetical protein